MTSLKRGLKLSRLKSQTEDGVKKKELDDSLDDFLSTDSLKAARKEVKAPPSVSKLAIERPLPAPVSEEPEVRPQCPFCSKKFLTESTKDRHMLKCTHSKRMNSEARDIQAAERASLGLPAEIKKVRRKKPEPQSDDLTLAMALSESLVTAEQDARREQEELLLTANLEAVIPDIRSEQVNFPADAQPKMVKLKKKAAAARVKPSKRDCLLMSRSTEERQRLIAERAAAVVTVCDSDPQPPPSVPLTRHKQSGSQLLGHLTRAHCPLWNLSSAVSWGSAPDAAFYVPLLRNVISPGKKKAGYSNILLHASQLPGHRLSQTLVPSTQDAEQVLEELALKADGGFFDDSGGGGDGAALVSLAADWSNLVGSSFLSDLCIRCSDGDFRAHRLVLAARCPHLLPLLFQPPDAPADTFLLDWSQFSCGAVGKVMEYVYSARFQGIPDDQVLHLARLYNISGLPELLEHSTASGGAGVANDAHQDMSVSLGGVSGRAGYLELSVAGEECGAASVEPPESSIADVEMEDVRAESVAAEEWRADEDSESSDGGVIAAEASLEQDIFQDSLDDSGGACRVVADLVVVAGSSAAIRTTDGGLALLESSLLRCGSRADLRRWSPSPDLFGDSSAGAPCIDLTQSDRSSSPAAPLSQQSCAALGVTLLNRSSDSSAYVDDTLPAPSDDDGDDAFSDVHFAPSPPHASDNLIATRRSAGATNYSGAIIDCSGAPADLAHDDDDDSFPSPVPLCDRLLGATKRSGGAINCSGGAPAVELWPNEPEQSYDWHLIDSQNKTPQCGASAAKKRRIEVTPQPDFQTMDTPILRKELDKYGLKPLKRKNAVKLLEHIYEELHPLVTDTESSFQATPERPPLESCADGDTQSDSGSDCDNAEESYLAVEQMELLEQADDWSCSQQVAAPRLIGDRFRQFLSERSDIYKMILTYEPIKFEWLHAQMRSSGLRCNAKTLLDLLDQQCITFRINNKRTNNKSPGGSKSPRKSPRKSPIKAARRAPCAKKLI